MNTSSIFIKTFDLDICWVEWALKFLRKSWLSDSQVVISAPQECGSAMKEFPEILGKPITFAYLDQWPESGWLFQQYVKHCADLYCSGDLITFIDSEAMLIFPTTVEENLCVDGKPIIWYTEYARLNAPWQRVVVKALGMEPAFEFMRCFPFTYHRSTLTNCREHLESTHGQPLEQLMRGPRTWTEFNVIGFYAYVFERDNYTWKHTDEMFTPDGIKRHWHDRIRQFHNRQDWDQPTRDRLQAMLDSEEPKWI